MDYILLIGLAGMTLILVAFILNVFKRLESHSQPYLWLNLVGGTLIVIYTALVGAIPVLILNAFWTVAAAWGLLHHHGKRK